MGLAVKSAGCRNMQAGVGLQQLIRKALQTNGAAPKQRSRAGSFTMKFGMVVMAVGLLNLALPELGLKAGGGDPASANYSLAVGSAQTLGLVTFVIGWFNYLGGKADAEWFLCGAILDRLAAYLVVVPLALLGRIPVPQFLAQTVLDLGSALYTWKLYSEDQTERRSSFQGLSTQTSCMTRKSSRCTSDVISQGICRALEAEAQQVVEIIAPGPQGTSAKAWDQAKRQASADRVRAAIQNWKAQYQEHDHTAYTRKP